MLRVSRQPGGEPEIFHSLQGEGANVGVATAFLRLAQCNLACTWCDTRYTWDWQRYDYHQEVLSLEASQVAGRILEFDCRHLVITGGEPLLQQEELAPLAASLKERGYYLEVETNGTIAPSPEMSAWVDQWNVSPKLSSSGNPSGRREVPPALEAFRRLPNAYFKFVVVEPPDVDEVRAFRDRYSLPADRIILMPEGQEARTLHDRSEWISAACVEHGFRFSTRLHILLWGDKRGR